MSLFHLVFFLSLLHKHVVSLRFAIVIQPCSSWDVFLFAAHCLLLVGKGPVTIISGRTLPTTVLSGSAPQAS